MSGSQPLSLEFLKFLQTQLLRLSQHPKHNKNVHLATIAIFTHQSNRSLPLELSVNSLSGKIKKHATEEFYIFSQSCDWLSARKNLRGETIDYCFTTIDYCFYNNILLFLQQYTIVFTTIDYCFYNNRLLFLQQYTIVFTTIYYCFYNNILLFLQQYTINRLLFLKQ